MERFQSFCFPRLGDTTDVLQVDCLGVCPLADDEVRIQVEAFAPNRADWLFTTGWHYSVSDLPSRIGSKCAGRVVEVGSAVDQSLIGRQVCAIAFDNSKYGARGEFAQVPLSNIAPWPADLSAKEATSVWMQYLTAYFALIKVAGIQTDDVIFVPAAGSSAGLAAIQIAKFHGSKVIAGTRASSTIDAILSAGADHVVMTANPSALPDTLRSLTGMSGVRIVFDPVGGDSMHRYKNALGHNAQIVLFGLLSGQQNWMNLVPLIRANATVHAYSVFNHVTDLSALADAIKYVELAIEQGMRPVIDTVFGWGGTSDAYRHLDSQTQIGRTVVSVERIR